MIISSSFNFFASNFKLTNSGPLPPINSLMFGLEFFKILIASINKSIPIILQPVTPIRKITHPPTWQDILRGYQAVSNLVDTVRVIPQAHKMMGIP